jgi:hypothetical protein
MPNLPDNLATLKDDMVAFIEGHGMRRFPGYVDHEEVQVVMWKPGDDPAEGWKDFVELAKAAGSPNGTTTISGSWKSPRISAALPSMVPARTKSPRPCAGT